MGALFTGGAVAIADDAALSRALNDGEVVLTVRIDERGDAKSVSIDQTPDGRLSDVVAATLTRMKFKPGLCEAGRARWTMCSGSISNSAADVTFPTESRDV